jgi:dipeptidyl aminopeptidase/acylaminoacyl peptidase
MKLRTLAFYLVAYCGQLVHAAPPPAQRFFEHAQYSDARISPSGRYVAFRVGNDVMRDSLAVLDTSSMKLVGSARLDGQDIGAFRWIHDNRLVFTIDDRTEACGDKRYAPGLFAMDRDGSNLRRLADRTWRTDVGTMIKQRVQPWNTYLMEQEGPQSNDLMHVLRPVWREDTYEIERYDLVQLDTATGLAEAVSRPAAAQDWLLDQKGTPRLMISSKDNRRDIHFNDPASSKWRIVATSAAFSIEHSFEPLGFTDAQHILVNAFAGRDKSSLRRFDLSTGQLDKDALVSLADYDFSGELIYIGDKLAGVHYLADGRNAAWFDPAMKAAQQAIDALLPATNNLITPPRHPQTPWVLVEAYSDRQPSSYLLFNTETKALTMLGGHHPDIQPAEMGQQDLMKVKARDGMTLPVWLTLPKNGGKKLPMVVMVHGGPYTRGTEWGWNANGQFLASRGYAVLEPEFRGSTGYGANLFAGGKKQWGLTMQDDIADAVKWAVAQGIADPERICIMGGSYGGYATLMGLVKDPELYRCGIAYAAVTDIPLMFDSGTMVLSDMSDQYKQYGAPELVGDVQKDAEQFRLTSPLQQAARIKRPLLLAHGMEDHRVPLAHFHKLRSALQANHANAEFVEYQGEAHGWSLLSTRLDFWGRVEKFLDKHLGAEAKTE